jgi:hypothetical protein
MITIKTEMFKNRTVSLPDLGEVSIPETGLFEVESESQANTLLSIEQCDFQIHKDEKSEEELKAEKKAKEEATTTVAEKARKEAEEKSLLEANDSVKVIQLEAEAQKDAEEKARLEAEAAEKKHLEDEKSGSSLVKEDYLVQLKKLTVIELQALVKDYPEEEKAELKKKQDYIDYIISKM